jgi:hypothetical protein
VTLKARIGPGVSEPGNSKRHEIAGMGRGVRAEPRVRPDVVRLGAERVEIGGEEQLLLTKAP